MRILFPIGTFYPAQSGGPGNSTYWLARALNEQGLSITVITSSTDQPAGTCLDQWLATEAGRVRYVRTKNHQLPWKVALQSLRALPNVNLVHLTSFSTTTLTAQAVNGLNALIRSGTVLCLSPCRKWRLPF